MNRHAKNILILTSILCLTPMLLGALLYAKLPSQVPIHFNFSGEVDGYASKAMACFGTPALLLLMNIVVNIALEFDPKRKNDTGVFVTFSKFIIPVVSILVTLLCFGSALGIDLAINQILFAFLALLWIFIGLYLPKCPQNYTIGIKLPWTLHSAENWQKTHRLAGIVWPICGFILLFALPFDFFVAPIASIAFSCSVLIPSIYSFYLYRKGA